MTQGEQARIAVNKCLELLLSGQLPPWKIEDEIVSTVGFIPPGNFKVAALCRQKFIEETAGEQFRMSPLV